MCPSPASAMLSYPTKETSRGHLQAVVVATRRARRPRRGRCRRRSAVTRSRSSSRAVTPPLPPSSVKAPGTTVAEVGSPCLAIASRNPVRRWADPAPVPAIDVGDVPMSQRDEMVDGELGSHPVVVRDRVVGGRTRVPGDDDDRNRHGHVRDLPSGQHGSGHHHPVGPKLEQRVDRVGPRRLRSSHRS